MRKIDYAATWNGKFKHTMKRGFEKSVTAVFIIRFGY